MYKVTQIIHELKGKISRKQINILISMISTVVVMKWLNGFLQINRLSHSIWSVFAAVSVYFILQHYDKIQKNIDCRRKKYVLCFSALFAVSETAGKGLVHYANVFAWSVSGLLEQFAVWAVLCGIGYCLIQIGIEAGKKVQIIEKWEAGNRKRWGILFSWIAIVIGWMPTLLAYYPGIFAYDAPNQIIQVLNSSYSTHHPIVHTILMGRLFQLGHALGDNNLGVLFYSLIQMFILAFSFAYCLNSLYKLGLKKKYTVILTGIIILFPINSILAVSLTKDVLFAAFTLLFVTSGVNICFKQCGKRTYALYLCTLVGMMLFRNNAVYAGIVASVILVFQKKRNKGSIRILVIAICISLGIENMLTAATHAQPGSIVEMLSVPLQQMAKTGKDHLNEMSEDIKEGLTFFIPEEIVLDYSPSISDGVKDRIDDEKIREDFLRFLKIYIKIGVKYPLEYINAYGILTQGFWYIEDTSHAGIYGEGIESRAGYLLTNYKEMPEGYEVRHISYFQWLENRFEKLFSANKIFDIPILSIFFVPAFSGWFLAAYVMRMLYYRKGLSASALVLVLYYLTLLLGPTCIVRYIYPIMVCVPVLCGCIFCEPEV